MGAPKRPKKKYKTPAHPWQRERIEQEKVLLKEYGLKNKKEIWRVDSLLGRFKQQAKNLIARTDAQSKIEEKQLVDKLTKLNLVTQSAKMDDILGLDIKNVMGRRLQTQVFSKGFAKSIKQARQFITHGHIFVGDKKVTIPSYLVKLDEEAKIVFDDSSNLSSPEHPERIIVQKKEKKKVVKRIKSKPGARTRKAKPEKKDKKKKDKKKEDKKPEAKKGEKSK